MKTYVTPIYSFLAGLFRLYSINQRNWRGRIAVTSGNSTASIGFEQQIWAAADILRGNMDVAEYNHVVLGLIFLKYISDKFEERYQELLADDDDVIDIIGGGTPKTNGGTVIFTRIT